jgi:hypothetical protein
LKDLLTGSSQPFLWKILQKKLGFSARNALRFVQLRVLWLDNSGMKISFFSSAFPFLPLVNLYIMVLLYNWCEAKRKNRFSRAKICVRGGTNGEMSVLWISWKQGARFPACK